ncbi:unnamed protein product [Acanthosepion pharaonis]|uniref:Uncharacterized protein n=1 Tax=Acanthosepion pharaonis TaxID=158019 RepID=A0A812E089_ACAPH|nr:unnamed protein product [Sepia pharaonis]
MFILPIIFMSSLGTLFSFMFPLEFLITLFSSFDSSSFSFFSFSFIRWFIAQTLRLISVFLPLFFIAINPSFFSFFLLIYWIYAGLHTSFFSLFTLIFLIFVVLNPSFFSLFLLIHWIFVALNPSLFSLFLLIHWIFVALNPSFFSFNSLDLC